MKNLITIFSILLLASSITIAQTPCVGGDAAGFPCEGFDMQFNFSSTEMGAVSANDSWGWTDPQDGKEYALIGLNNGTAFFDLSDPVNVVYLGKLPTHTSNSVWRDVKTYANHAFIVSEAGAHGMQIFDLTRLRNVANPPVTFTEDAYNNVFGNAHNIVINEETGFAYVVGTSTYGGGPHFIDISDPINPTFEGGYALEGYTHDAQVVVYDGPDTDYTGREIFMGSNEDRLVIIDVTDKGNPITISNGTYGNASYTHQGWFTEDKNYFIVGDEVDELDFGFNTRTIIFDVSDLDDPQFSFEYFGPTLAIDHNGYVKGNTYYLANYHAGMRTIDISDIANGNISESGFFDSYPANDNTNFNGTWNVYPFFASGNIIISGSEGFFLVKDPSLGLEDITAEDFSLTPNPAINQLTVSSKNEVISQVSIFNVLGQHVTNKTFFNNFSETFDITNLNSGIYTIKINQNTTKRLIKK
jgi:choice-of-anchor B domain-containing protein